LDVKRYLTCPCGASFEAEDDDELVRIVREHLVAEHPEQAEQYGREEILFLAE